MKIVYCTDSICYAGGIQRITITKANELAQIDGNEVWIIVTDNKRKAVSPLSPKVHLIDLDINYFEDDWKSYFHVLKGIIYKRTQHKKKLKKVLRQIEPDVVISTGTSEKNFLPCLSIKSNLVFIREIHNNKNYRLSLAHGFIATMIAIWGDFIDYGIYIKRYDKIVVLTNEDKTTNWKNNKKVIVIPNSVTSLCSQQSLLTTKKVIAIGRLTFQKNFESLINSWQYVERRHKNWTLEIWGEGGLKAELEKLINQHQLAKSVLLKGYTYDIYSKLHDASIFALTSRIEGFGLVIVEAMSCGLPIVSYSCPCGPKDIITDGKDGFLVPVNDEKALAEKICYLIEHEEERKSMGMAAREKSKQYSIDNITHKWMDLFNKLIDEKHGK